MRSGEKQHRKPESSLPNGQVALIIPTFNAARYWPDLSRGIRAQSLKPERVIVIDSSSTDGTAELARRDGFEVVEISPSDFNHGGTRQMGADYAADANLLIYLTQDAAPDGTEAFANLARAFSDPEIGAAYGRQLPRQNASPIEAHARLFSYSQTSKMRSWESRKAMGFKSIFFSNAFGAYRREALMSVGGFSPNVIFGEDIRQQGGAEGGGPQAAGNAYEMKCFSSHRKLR